MLAEIYEIRECVLRVIQKTAGATCWVVRKEDVGRRSLQTKRFTSINSEIGIRRVAANEDDVILQKLG